MWPFFSDLTVLCQGPLHIFFTLAGHIASCNSSTLSITRSHGRSFLDNHVRNLFKVSSMLSFVDEGMFLRESISATDLFIFSSLSPLIQNTPPWKQFLSLQANSTAKDVLPHPPSPHIVLVQQEVCGLASTLFERKLFSSQSRADSRPVNNGNLLGAVHNRSSSLSLGSCVACPFSKTTTFSCKLDTCVDVSIATFCTSITLSFKLAR